MKVARSCDGRGGAGGRRAPVMANIVQFENVGLRYDGAEETLSDLSFSLASGAFYFLTGASGAGKTSLLKLLYLAQRPSRGVIRLFGEDMVTLPRRRLPGFRRRIGVVFQDFRLVPHLSIADNVALPMRVAGIPEADIAEPVREMLAWVGLGERANAKPATLSAFRVAASELRTTLPAGTPRATWASARLASARSWPSSATSARSEPWEASAEAASRIRPCADLPSPVSSGSRVNTPE